MHDIKKAAAYVQEIEDILLKQASLKESVAKSRIIAQAVFHFAADKVKFTIFLKEVQMRPQFFTLKFDLPAQKSFTFTSFDRTGKRMFNKIKFREMMSFLRGSNVAEEFERLLAEKVREASA